MSEVLATLKSLFAQMAAAQPTEDDLIILRFALLLKLGLNEIVENEFQAIVDKHKAWRLLSRAVNITHGEGYVFTQHGVARALDATFSGDRKRLALELVCDLLGRVSHEFGLTTYLTSGTLLGLVREGDLIAHDDDIDSAYLSHADGYLNWALEWVALTNFINSLPGFTAVQHLPGLLHVSVSFVGGPLRFDLFSALVENGYVNEYPLDPDRLQIREIEPVQRREFLGTLVPVPADAEALLKLNYGDGWISPDPSFRFNWAAAERNYRNRLIGMSRTLPKAGWLRDNIPVVCGNSAPHGEMDFAEYKIAAISHLLSTGLPGSNVLIFGFQSARLIDWCVETCLARGLNLWLADLDCPLDEPFAGLQAGTEIVNRSILEKYATLNGLAFGGSDVIASHLKNKRVELDFVFLDTCTSGRTTMAYESICASLAEECSFVFDDMILETDGTLETGQYQALLRENLDTNRSFRIFGRTRWSQVLVKSKVGLTASHAI